MGPQQQHSRRRAGVHNGRARARCGSFCGELTAMTSQTANVPLKDREGLSKREAALKRLLQRISNVLGNPRRLVLFVKQTASMAGKGRDADQREAELNAREAALKCWFKNWCLEV